MNAAQRTTVIAIRNLLRLRRLDPRRLFLIDDGAYRWIGDRADLTSAAARCLRGVHAIGTRPNRATKKDRADAESVDYSQVCGQIPCIASSCGSGQESWSDLLPSWQDGTALGPISPLRR